MLEHASQHRLNPITFGVLPVIQRRVRFGLGALMLMALIFTMLVLVTHWTLRWLVAIVLGMLTALGSYYLLFELGY